MLLHISYKVLDILAYYVTNCYLLVKVSRQSNYHFNEFCVESSVGIKRVVCITEFSGRFGM